MASLASQIRTVGSFTATGISVLIIGSGLGGLTAAIECFRKGHDVQVFERNDGPNTAGMSLS